jgi:hypothetical protein
MFLSHDLTGESTAKVAATNVGCQRHVCWEVRRLIWPVVTSLLTVYALAICLRRDVVLPFLQQRQAEAAAAAAAAAAQSQRNGHTLLLLTYMCMLHLW